MHYNASKPLSLLIILFILSASVKKLPSRKDLKLVPPTLNKVDLPHLKNDINKYHDVGVLPLTEYAWWKRFLGSFELHYGSLPKESPPCMLEKLDYIRASTSAPPERVPIISKRVQDYHHNQINSSTKVCKILQLCMGPEIH